MSGKLQMYTFCSIAALMSAPAAFAQQADTSALLPDIVVTAEKRSANLQDAPAGIVALSGDQLSIAGVTDQSQLTKVVPGLFMASQGGTGLFFIRGIGQTQGAANTQPAVAVNMNGVYWSREMGATPLFDLERVEVLPGPQGTLYGTNAAGGAINFLTKRPTRDFSGEVIVEAGNYDLLHFTGVANAPLSNNLAVRVAYDSNNRSGYLTNGAFDADDQTLRVSALYEQGPLTIFAMAMHMESGGTGNNSILYNAAGLPGPFNPTPNNLYNQTFPAKNLYIDASGDFLQAQIDYRLSDDLTLTYTPGYVDYKAKKNQQFSGTTPTLLEPGVRDQYTHELRLTNGLKGRWKWVLGAFAHRSTHPFNVTAGTNLPAPSSITRLTNNIRSVAVFGEATYSLTDSFRLTAGGRYSRDRFFGDSLTTSPPASAASPITGTADVTDSRGDWKIGTELDLRDGKTLLYATVQTGYLMGGFVQDGTLLDPETLTAYTVGTKNRFLDDRLQVNAEAYYYDYKGYQLSYVQGFFFAAQNAPARVTGLQLDLALAPTDNDTLTVNSTIQEAKILDKRLFPRDGAPTSIHGFELPNAADVTVTASWRHVFDLKNGGQISSRLQTYYSSGYWMVFTHDLNTRQGAYTNTDFSLTYEEPDRRWSVSAWVRNIEDDAVLVGANKPRPGTSSAPYLLPPRTWGVTARASF